MLIDFIATYIVLIFIFRCAAVVWIIMSFIARIMQAIAFGLFPNGPYILHIRWTMSGTTLSMPAQIVLGSLCLAGFIFYDIIYLAVIIVYIFECEFARKVVNTHSEVIQEGKQVDKIKIPLSPLEVIQVSIYVLIG